MKIDIKETISCRKIGAYSNKPALYHAPQADSFSAKKGPNAFSSRIKIDGQQKLSTELDAKKPWWSASLLKKVPKIVVPREIILRDIIAGQSLKDILDTTGVHFDPMSIDLPHEID